MTGPEEKTFRLPQWRFRSDIRKDSFTERAVTHWSRLSREVLWLQPLEIFQNLWVGCLETEWVGQAGSVGLVVGLKDLRGLSSTSLTILKFYELGYYLDST